MRTGNDLDIECQAHGVPNPIVTWTRLERVIKNHNLVLKRVRRSDSGVYLCKAYNKAGEDRKEVIVTVSDHKSHNDESPQITGKVRVILALCHMKVTYIIGVAFEMQQLANIYPCD